MSEPDPSLDALIAPILATVAPVAERFEQAGHTLFLVGGVVRDLLLGHHGAGEDIDLTSDARPEVIRQLVSPIADALWTQGERFGTIGATVGGRALEITTHRAESYTSDSRKPVVSFGEDLRTDLSRRDFTINAMAISVIDGSLHDPFGGRPDLDARRLATPLDPAISFTDDPLRMMRAARFIPRLDLSVDPALRTAVMELAGRLKIVSVERIHDEFEKLLASGNPRTGLDFLVDTGLLAQFAPLISAATIPSAGLALSPTERVLDRLTRRALLMVGAERGQVEAWLHTMKYSTQTQRATLRCLDGLTTLLGWSDEAVSPDAADLRRLVAALEPEELLAAFVAAECVAGAPHPAEAALTQLGANEDLSDLEPPVGGGELIKALDLSPGPGVGDLVRQLKAHRLEHGPMTTAEAIELARSWVNGRD